MLPFSELTIPSGADILHSLEDFMLQNGWEEAVVVCAIGSVQDLVFATPIQNELPLRVSTFPCWGAAEILSFNGEIMLKERMDPALKDVYPVKESPLFTHIHASCARAGGQVTGGGLWGGKAFRSLRVFLYRV